MSGDDTTISDAVAAWSRIERTSSFDDWITVARALAIGRAYAMQLARTNKPFGRRFVAAIGAWLREHRLDQIPGQERHAALRMLDHIEEIEQWRAGLDPAVRRRLNHPNAVWWKWKRATASSSTAPSRRTMRKLVQLGIDQAQIARASDAVFALLKVNCRDSMVIARAALMAATKAPQRRERQRPHAVEAQVAT